MMAGQSTVDVDTDLIASAMHKLSIGCNNIVDVLTDCNIYLSKLNRSDLYKAANVIDLNLIFDCLNTTDEKQIEIACLLLKKLLSVLLPKYAFNKYSISIKGSLHHPSDVVKSTILSELEKLLAVDNDVDIQVDLACVIVVCLTNSVMSVSYNAVKCLKKLNIEILSSPPILSQIKSMMLMDAKIRTRIYDVLIHWATSDDALSLITSKGLFSNLVNDITGSDVMMQMVIIQMLIPLSITEVGFDYLSSVGIISGLYRLLSSSPAELDDPKAFILNPIVMEFFIKNVQIRPHLILTTYPKVFVVIYEILKEREYPRAGVAINAIISLASSWDCKIALNVPTTIKACGFQGEEELDIWSIFIMELSDIATGVQNDLKAGAIQAITRIIQVESGELSSRNDMFTHTHKWYKQIKDNPLKNIVQTSCRRPFLDIQQAGFEMLQVLAEQPWGQEEINKYPSLLDIVFKHCPKDPIVINDLKNMIIKTLLESDTSKDILNEDLMSRIKNNGAVQFDINSSQPEVAVEDMAVE